MIQTSLFFLLGFLCAGLAAILFAPFYRRRAERLTRRRLEATLPLSINEIQAERDQVRADHAMVARRLEIEATRQREKANNRAVDIARLRQEIGRLGEEAEAAATAIGERGTTIEDLERSLAEHQEQLAQAARRLADAERAIDESGRALEALSQLQEETSLVSSGRQVELASRDTEIQRLSTKIEKMRTQRQDVEQKSREANAGERRLSEDLKGERRKVADLEARLARLMSELSDSHEALERQKRISETSLRAIPEDGSDTDTTAEIARLLSVQAELMEALDRAKAKPASKDDATRLKAELEQARTAQKASQTSEEELRLQLTQAQADCMRLEAEIADMDGRGDGQFDKGLERLEADRDRLEARLTALAEENERLRGESLDDPATKALRADLADVAAQMVHLTRLAEGPGSPIDALLDGPKKRGAKNAQPTLADRIRALRDADLEHESPKPVKRNR